ncbi:unnamed protein product [Lepeophtheirus salmonis]|uniref:(salmon louse) hypothetical protein n=1 Tax=Lepeophtheirus salmonis TaxID=72036 RepID=A0A7R8GYK8_LEPSM|nr:unnamed protein product [Lepeophtheirus salmonis]CAF2749556.1 unnamed protein product [Lepeophtheirus salmonis]
MNQTTTSSVSKGLDHSSNQNVIRPVSQQHMIKPLSRPQVIEANNLQLNSPRPQVMNFQSRQQAAPIPLSNLQNQISTGQRHVRPNMVLSQQQIRHAITGSTETDSMRPEVPNSQTVVNRSPAPMLHQQQRVQMSQNFIAQKTSKTTLKS